MRILVGLGVLVLVGVVGCSTPSPGPGGSGAPGSGAPGSAPKQTLASEQRRLAELFKGTPVVLQTPREGSLRIAEPLEFAFDKGRFVVKPPLGKVLDLVARSQRGEPTRFAISAPTDPQSRAQLLATERANSTRDYLVARGVAPTRFTVAALASGDSVVIVITEPPAP
jgi:outer membrane protein OmpA-like peptidoglycan-associated protein